MEPVTPTRTLAVTQKVTVDSRVDMLGDWFDPQAQDDDLLAFTQQQDARCDAVLLGRQTFVDFRGYWQARADDETGISSYLDTVTKYVVTSTLTEPEWPNSTILAGDPVSEVGRLKEKQGGDIVVTGSVTLTHALLRAGLVDELRLFTYPVLQGRGRHLTPDGWAPDRIRRIESRPFLNGVTYAAYAL